MRLPGSGITNQQDVLPFIDVFTAHQLQHQGLVDRIPGGEVKRLQGLDVGELCRFQSPVGRTLFTVDEFLFTELQ